MILGSCNYGQEYNNSFIKEKEAIEIIKEFEQLGGKIIDSASNYKSLSIIKKAKWKGKVITKIWEETQLQESLEQLGTNKIYACLYRGKSSKKIEFLHDCKKDGIIEEVGQSIYIDHEISQRVNIIQIPFDELWLKWLPTMLLYANVQFRSFYNLYKAMKNSKYSPKVIKEQYNRPDLNHKVEFVVGCDNIEQLRQNMEYFG